MSGSELTLELTDILINGKAYPLLTSTYEIRGNGEGSNTAKKIIGGAGLGGLIGGLTGGGKRWDWCARRCWWQDSHRRFQMGRAAPDPQRIFTRVLARTTGDTAGGRIEPLFSSPFAERKHQRTHETVPQRSREGVASIAPPGLLN